MCYPAKTKQHGKQVLKMYPLCHIPSGVQVLQNKNFLNIYLFS